MSSAFAAAPSLSKEIADAARDCGVSEEVLLSSALAANIGPTTIGEATAAGEVPTGNITGPITPSSLSTNTGTGGGGSASPSI